MEIDELNKFLEITDSKVNIILNSVLDKININDTINVSDSIYKDTKINEWITKKTITKGGAIIMDKIIKNPINDINILTARQKTNYEIFNYQLETLKESENDLIWIMTLKKDIDEDLSINLLFPSTFIINKINNYHFPLDMYHFYKIILMPITSLIYPLSIIYSPYYYLNKYMHLNMSMKQYLKILFQFLKLLLKPSGNIKADVIKIITFCLYIGIYIYSIYQTFLISYISYKTREKLLNKIKGLVDFIKTSIVLIKKSREIWKPFFIYNNEINNEVIKDSIQKLENINYDITTIYKLWKNENYKNHIINILKVVYTLDVINTITKLKKNKYWCIPTFNTTNTLIWDVRNPFLSDSQISNPVNLQKNMIITGVNAGGKTTYVKSIAANIILAQTIGIINASKGNLLIYDAINSFMRISDEVGVKSYFEAETDYCSKMIEIADNLTKNNKKGLFILDEPMHSTPPIEGMSVAFSVAEYLGNKKGITVIITTHFHKLIELEDKYKDSFINISVNAKKDINDNYVFDYKICKGGSKQTIAIELLKRQKFNNEIINSAIEMKNKLCNENLRNDI